MPEPVETPARKRLDPERTRQDILAAAHEEFVQHGLSGARVDAIAARTNTAKRMIYYYFGSKEGLYLAVLERAYTAIRIAEAALELDLLPPRTAIQRMVEFTFDYHDAHPDFVRLVSIRSNTIRTVSMSVAQVLQRILDRGRAAGLFRADLDALDVHMMISSLSIFRVANRHTFTTLFPFDMDDAALRQKHRAFMVEAVLRSLELREPAGQQDL
jgi:AcrR family transcriptional regulator